MNKKQKSRNSQLANIFNSVPHFVQNSLHIFLFALFALIPGCPPKLSPALGSMSASLFFRSKLYWPEQILLISELIVMLL